MQRRTQPLRTWRSAPSCLSHTGRSSAHATSLANSSWCSRSQFCAMWSITCARSRAAHEAPPRRSRSPAAPLTTAHEAAPLTKPRRAAHDSARSADRRDPRALLPRPLGLRCTPIPPPVLARGLGRAPGIGCLGPPACATPPNPPPPPPPPHPLAPPARRLPHVSSFGAPAAQQPISAPFPPAPLRGVAAGRASSIARATSVAYRTSPCGHIRATVTAMQTRLLLVTVRPRGRQQSRKARSRGDPVERPQRPASEPAPGGRVPHLLEELLPHSNEPALPTLAASAALAARAARARMLCGARKRLFDQRRLARHLQLRVLPPRRAAPPLRRARQRMGIPRTNTPAGVDANAVHKPHKCSPGRGARRAACSTRANSSSSMVSSAWRQAPGVQHGRSVSD